MENLQRILCQNMYDVHEAIIIHISENASLHSFYSINTR